MASVLTIIKDGQITRFVVGCPDVADILQREFEKAGLHPQRHETDNPPERSSVEERRAMELIQLVVISVEGEPLH